MGLISQYTKSGKHISKVSPLGDALVHRKCDVCGEEKWVLRRCLTNLEYCLCNGCNRKSLSKLNMPKMLEFSRNQQSGQDNHNWKGGRRAHCGYVQILVNRRYWFEHRLIMEKELGRPLKKNEIVHHIDMDRGNNNILNLVVLTKSEHKRLHNCVQSLAVRTLADENRLIFDRTLKLYKLQ